ncbi:MAG: hypothetical protein U5R49_12465 [Deltaproteobacteria bacterium]|nr:hypothetical protein [Deltaproteobacteria bacterium]
MRVKRKVRAGRRDELGDETDSRGLGGDHDPFEIRQLEVQGHAEHHEPDGGVDDKQHLRIEVKPDLIDSGWVHIALP